MMARMPIDPRLARMIVGGAHFGVLKEILIVVSALAVQDPRERPAINKCKLTKSMHYSKADSDFLFYLKLWETLNPKGEAGMSENKRRQFAKHF